MGSDAMDTIGASFIPSPTDRLNDGDLKCDALKVSYFTLIMMFDRNCQCNATLSKVKRLKVATRRRRFAQMAKQS